MNRHTYAATRWRTLAALVAIPQLVCGAAGAAVLHTDAFDVAGTSGWTGGAFGGQVITRQTSGGPGGDGDAYLRLQTTASNLATHNSTPAWVGDFTAVDAARVTVDLRSEVGSDPLAIRVVLFGPGSTSFRWTSSAPADVPADGLWRSYEFSLAEEALSLVQGVTTYDAMMQNVFRVMIRHDPSPASPGGQAVSAALGIDNIRLAAAPAPGDYDDDGDIDAADYSVWSAEYGSDGSTLADGNHDGVVDAADYTVWRDALPETPGAIPEPGSLSLVLWVLVASCFGRRRHVRPGHLPMLLHD